MHDKLLIIPFRVISKRINNFSFVESDFFSSSSFHCISKKKQRSVVRTIFILFFSLSLSYCLRSMVALLSLKIFFSSFRFVRPFVQYTSVWNFFLFLFLLLCIVFCLPVHELTFLIFFSSFSMSVFLFFSLLL